MAEIMTTIGEAEIFYDAASDYLYLKDNQGGLIGAPLTTWELNAETLKNPQDILRVASGIKLITAQERWKALKLER
jgi:hypothetical protein